MTLATGGDEFLVPVGAGVGLRKGEFRLTVPLVVSSAFFLQSSSPAKAR